MLLSDVAVKRPVFAMVISLLLVAFGFVSYERLSLREYPDIDPPIVTVEVVYPGAPANIVETRVTRLVEERLAGIEGIELIQSSSRDGRAEVSIEFSVNRDIDAAANDVRDRVSGITDDLPEEAEAPEVQKADSNNDVIIWQNLTSDRLSVPELSDYAQRYLVDQYSTLNGVARVLVSGGLHYALRVWLDRQELAARHLSVADVERALRAENIELPAGALESNKTLFQARIDRAFKQTQDFNQLVIAQGNDGYLIRLGDVARVELGVEEDRTFFRGNTVPMVGIGIIRQSTANTIDVADAVETLTDRLNQNLPAGMLIKKSFNAAVYIKATIKEVYKTLFTAVACVVFVIYLFLGSLRPMLIPAVTVPVSLVATFIVIYALGFSINLLTLLALVLAIGLVVDDAIVMLENIVRRMQEHNESPLVASYRGARQVAFAIISTTLVLIAVFVPITFLSGDIGRLFTEFALTLSAAVAFSSLIALTLSPVLATKILKKNGGDDRTFFLVRLIDTLLARARSSYLNLLRKAMKQPFIAFAIFILFIGLSASIYPKISNEFAPREDRGSFFILVNGPEGASYRFVKEYMDEIEKRLLPYVESGEVNRLLLRAPRTFGQIENFNDGLVIINLHDWAVRRSGFKIMQEIRDKLADLPGVRIIPIMRQPLGGGISKPVQFVLGGANYEDLAAWRDQLLKQISSNNPGFIGLDSDYKETRPQIDFKVDYHRAADLGVTISEIGRTLETMMGGRNVTTFLHQGEEYNVILEGERESQRSFNDIENIYVKSLRTGELIPLSNLVSIYEYAAPKTLSRFNRIRSITIDANLTNNLVLGDALDYLEALAREHLPSEVIIDFKGQSRDLNTSSTSILFVFLLGLLVVFLTLAAQFESWIHPLVIMLTVPLAIGGGLLGLYLTGSSLNIYSQIGLIMLVGLAAKNGILIVEFANQLRDQGVEFSQAILDASKIRFRPILMTGLTTIAGTVPLVLSSGAGYETRQVIGIVVLSGVFIATIFTLFIIPLAYALIAQRTQSPNTVTKQLEREIK